MSTATGNERKAPPQQVKRFQLGSCSVTLKRWPSDGSHSIEISQKDHEANQYTNIGIPLHLAPALQSALGSAFAIGQKAEAEAI